MPISMSSPSASIVATPVGADCSTSASCSTRSLPHPLDIGLHALALKHKTTTSSGHCTQAATPLSLLFRKAVRRGYDMDRVDFSRDRFLESNHNDGRGAYFQLAGCDYCSRPPL